MVVTNAKKIRWAMARCLVPLRLLALAKLQPLGNLGWAELCPWVYHSLAAISSVPLQRQQAHSLGPARKQWDKLSGEANLYSAYFVPDQNVFLWQDTDNTVTAQTVDGELRKQFRHFPTYGHVISSDFGTYLSSDELSIYFLAMETRNALFSKTVSSPALLEPASSSTYP